MHFMVDLELFPLETHVDGYDRVLEHCLMASSEPRTEQVERQKAVGERVSTLMMRKVTIRTSAVSIVQKLRLPKLGGDPACNTVPLQSSNDE